MAKNGATKEVSVKEKTGELVLRRVLDREQQSQYTIRAKACDHGNPVKCSTTDIVIKVLVSRYQLFNFFNILRFI